jgi:hypothetical protein
MPINSTLDVVVQQDDLIVLGPPTTVDISLDIGAQGDPGSQIYTGDFDPNSITTTQFYTLYGSNPQGNDLFLRNDAGEYYGVFYAYVSVPGGSQWEPVLEIQEAVELFLNSNTGFILSASAGGTGINNGSNTFTFDGNIEFAGGNNVILNSTGNTDINLPETGDVATLQNNLGEFASTTSTQLRGVISDETGTGNLVFNTSPNLSTSLTTSDSSFSLLNTNATTVNFAGAATNLNIGANEAGATNIRTAATNLTGDLQVGGGDLTVTEATFNLANTTATTVNFAGAATSLNMGAGTGTTTINNDLVVDGDLTVNGSTTVINSTITSLDDPVLVLGGDTTPTSDDNKDRGIEFKWHDGSSAKLGFFGFDDSTGRFTFIPDATNTSEVFSGTLGDIEVGDIIADDLAVNGGDITTTATTFNLVNDTATTVNFAGAATGLSIGASTGLTTINNDLLVSASHLATVDAAQFTTIPGVSASVGRLMWNDDDGTLDLGLKGGNVILQVGQEFVARAFNNSASVINDGDIVVIDGAQGQRVSVTLADASSVDSGHAFGMATETIGVGEEGFITTQGTVRNIDTYIDGTSEGAEIYLSPTTPGAWTVTRPDAPDHAVRIGWIQREHAVSGSIYIKIDSGNHLEWLHDVLITSETNNDVLIYNSASSAWVNTSASNIYNDELAVDAVAEAISNGTQTNVTITYDDNANSLSFDVTGAVADVQGTTNEIEVTSASNIYTVGLPNDVTVTNDLTVGGNLTVSGSVVYLNVEELLVEDNVITLNSGVSASPTLNAGIEVERGTELNTAIIWNETLDQWEFTNDGTTYSALGSGTGDGGFTNHFLMMGA